MERNWANVALVLAALLIALASVVLPLSSCSTANVSAASGPVLDSSQIAPVNLQVSQTAAGWSMDVTTRGPQLEQAVIVHTDNTEETATLSGTSAQLSSSNRAPVACVMVMVSKNGGYWYPDGASTAGGSGDYWYFDSAGQLMRPEDGAKWYAPAAE